MKACRTFGRMKALMGLGLLFLVSPSLNAAPVCSIVFAETASVDIEAPLKQLAELKLQIDLAEVDGTHSPLSKRVLSLEFNKKWEEIQKLSSDKPEKLKARLSKYIKSAQGRLKKGAQVERVSRAAVTKHIEPQSVELKTALRLSARDGASRSAFLEIFDDGKVILFTDRTGTLNRFQVGQKRAKSLGVRGAFGVLRQDNAIVMVTQKGDVSLLNIDGSLRQKVGVINSELLTRIERRFDESSIVVSPDEKSIALVEKGDVVFFNLQTKAAWRMTDAVNAFRDTVSKVTFLNNSEVNVYVDSLGLEVMRIDVAKQELDYLDYGSSLKDMTRDPDLQEDLLFYDERVGNMDTLVVRTTEGKGVSKKALMTLPPERFSYRATTVERIENSDLILINRYSDGNNKVEIYVLGEDAPVYVFDSLNGNYSQGVESKRDISAMRVTRDRKNIIILYHETLLDSGREYESRDLLEILALPNNL